MKHCPCSESHEPRRVVLTGGPGAGKTAVLELIRQSFCEHVRVLPEAAGVVFGGGFPRGLDAVRNPSPGLHAALALVLLALATVLGVYKPRSMTRYGWRKQHEARSAPPP